MSPLAAWNAACDAVMPHAPAPVIVMSEPFTPPDVHEPDATNVTGFPDFPPVALTVNGASPNVLVDGGVNAIVWAPGTSVPLPVPFLPCWMHVWYGAGTFEKKSYPVSVSTASTVVRYFVQSSARIPS